jgi:hypothetical protein
LRQSDLPLIGKTSCDTRQQLCFAKSNEHQGQEQSDYCDNYKQLGHSETAPSIAQRKFILLGIEGPLAE